MSGLAAIREKGRRWAGNIVEIHGGGVSDPVVAGEWFSVAMGIDATFKERGRMPMKKSASSASATARSCTSSSSTRWRETGAVAFAMRAPRPAPQVFSEAEALSVERCRLLH